MVSSKYQSSVTLKDVIVTDRNNNWNRIFTVLNLEFRFSSSQHINLCHASRFLNTDFLCRCWYSKFGLFFYSSQNQQHESIETYHVQIVGENPLNKGSFKLNTNKGLNSGVNLKYHSWFIFLRIVAHQSHLLAAAFLFCFKLSQF